MNKIDGLNFGETIYCIEQDIEEYIQNNNLEEDENLNLILKEIENLRKFKEIYDKKLKQTQQERDYYKQIVDGCPTDNDNCNFCEIDKQFQQLKQENEELRARNSRGTLAFLEEDFKKEQKIKKYKQCIDEIDEICKVNAINTCWTTLNQCDNCEEKEECGIQSPFVKLDIIRNIIKKTKDK